MRTHFMKIWTKLRPSLGSAGPVTILNYGRKVGKSRRPRIYRASPAFERVLESTTDVESAGKNCRLDKTEMSPCPCKSLRSRA